MTVNPLREDLDHILAHTEGLWEELRGQRLFITGGTGFFGCWLLESFAWANDRLGLKAEAVVLTRNPEAFVRKAPRLAGHPAISFHIGDIRSFEFPKGAFSHVIHAAAEFNTGGPIDALDTIINGTRRSLDFARSQGAVKFLLTSSGAVYGRQPCDLTHVPEDYAGGPDLLSPGSCYGEGKRVAELLCAVYRKDYGLDTRIARCFSFIGPYMPLEGHFAAGNFILDVVHGRPIHVKGDGSPCRSYLYASDLAVWLWTILLSARQGCVYNVGSEEVVNIGELSEKIASITGSGSVISPKAKFSGKPPERYVPSTRRAFQDLNLSAWIGLEEGLMRTMSWCRMNGLKNK
jgi:dTDP-glucose 4,6-dehydratase